MYFSFSPAPSPATSVSSLYSISPTSVSEKTQNSLLGQSCAYPSWPRRASLNDTPSSAPTSSSSSASSSRTNVGYARNYGFEEHVTAYVSDADLFPEFFDEDSDSDFSDASSAFSSPCGSPHDIIQPSMLTASMSIRASQTCRDLASMVKVGEKTLGKKKVVVTGRKVFAGRKGSKSSGRVKGNMSPIAECGE